MAMRPRASCISTSWAMNCQAAMSVLFGKFYSTCPMSRSLRFSSNLLHMNMYLLLNTTRQTRCDQANMDKPHGGDVRVCDNSGVYLAEPPFELPVQALKQVLEVPGVAALGKATTTRSNPHVSLQTWRLDGPPVMLVLQLGVGTPHRFFVGIEGWCPSYHYVASQAFHPSQKLPETWLEELTGQDRTGRRRP